MKEKKNKNINTLMGIIIILLVVIIIGLVIYILYNPKKVYDTQNNNDVNNNAIEEDIRDNNDNNDNVIISDHITNDKVQEIYDMVKIELDQPERIRYYEDGYFDNLYNKLNILLSYQKWEKTNFTDDQVNLLNTNNIGATVDKDYGYIKIEQVIDRMYDIFNINITRDDLVSIESSNFQINSYGTWTEFRYSKTIDGFISILWGAGDGWYYISKIYSYEETKSQAFVDTLLGIVHPTYEYYPKGSIYDFDNLIYDNIDLDTFEFSEEDKNKFTKLRYTFNKRDDGTYYFANVETID